MSGRLTVVESSVASASRADDAAFIVRQMLRKDGYWQATATLTTRATDPASGKVEVAIAVSPGVRHRIANARITSPDGRGVAETKLAAEPFAGRFATTRNLNAMRLAVDDTFRSEGYPDAEISMTRTVDAHF